MNSYYSETELLEMGFKHIGINVKISRKASIYGIENISIGDNSRIDDFTLLSGYIKIGKYVHISAYTALFAGESGIEIEDFCTISVRCNVFAVSDDYSGQALTNPMISDKYRLVTSKRVIFKKHAIVGTGSTVLPGVVVDEGASFGAMSLIIRDSKPWTMYVGAPARELRPRERMPLQLEGRFLEEQENE